MERKKGFIVLNQVIDGTLIDAKCDMSPLKPCSNSHFLDKPVKFRFSIKKSTSKGYILEIMVPKWGLLMNVISSKLLKVRYWHSF